MPELLKDAERCPRLTAWEEDFLESLRERIALYRAGTYVSARQLDVLERIKGKVYVTG